MSLPPAVAVSALYERLLHVALRQFFERATLRVDSAAKTMDEGRLEAMLASPAVMDIKWLGGHYALEVPAALPFTEHEVRFVAAIAAVLSARYHAILHASILTERGDLFRGAIEDRYVG